MSGSLRSNNGSSVTSPSRPTASPAADNSHLQQQQQQQQQQQYQQQPMYGMPLSSQPVHTTSATASTAVAATAATAASTAAAAVPGSSNQPGQQSNFVSTGPYQYQVFRTWLPLAERESDTKLKAFQSDGAGEYRSTEFTTYLQERGIRRLFSLPHAHQQSGVAERLNRTLQEKMRALLAQAQLGPLYWPFAMDHATLLHNLLSSTSLPNNASPHLLWTGKLGTTKLLRVFGLEHRTKHIALRYFLARELQQRGQLRLAYVATRANTADIFTKALQHCDHQRFCTMLGLVPTWPHLLTS
ncbi:unnamed protein product [Closterium sp. NIES-53]